MSHTTAQSAETRGRSHVPGAGGNNLKGRATTRSRFREAGMPAASFSAHPGSNCGRDVPVEERAEESRRSAASWIQTGRSCRRIRAGRLDGWGVRPAR